jgi:hypothetical protein
MPPSCHETLNGSGIKALKASEGQRDVTDLRLGLLSLGLLSLGFLNEQSIPCLQSIDIFHFSSSLGGGVKRVVEILRGSPR